MKRTDNDSQLAAWLEAEESGQDDAAQAALFHLFAELPRAQPRAGFAERVLRASGAVVRRPSRLRRRWLLAAAAVAALVLPAVVLTAALMPAHGGSVVALGVEGLLTASGWLSRLRGVLAVLGNLREALLAVASMPQVSLIGLSSLAVAALALRALAALTSRSGRMRYA